MVHRNSHPENEEDQNVHFKSHATGLKFPFVTYADFECYTQKNETCEGNPQFSGTTPYQKHTPSVLFVVVSSVPEYNKPAVVYGGDNATDVFIKKLLEAEKDIVSILSEVKPMALSPSEEMSFQEAEECHICNFTFRDRQSKRSQSFK